MKKSKINLILLLGFISIAQAIPSWMDIGTYALTQNESACWESLPFNVITDAFYNAAVSSRNILATKAPTQYPPYVTRHVNLTGSNVTISSVRPNNDREYCDLICYAGHGAKMGVAVYTDQHTCKVGWNVSNVGDFAFGTSYTRWVFFMSCNLLAYDVNDPLFWSTWNNAFKGAQLIFGYCNNFDVLQNYQINCVTKFWQEWTGTTTPQIPMATAYFDAVSQCVYEASNRSLDITPAVLTAASQNWEFFYDRTFNNSTSERARNGASMMISHVYTRIEPM